MYKHACTQDAAAIFFCDLFTLFSQNLRSVTNVNFSNGQQTLDGATFFGESGLVGNCPPSGKHSQTVNAMQDAVVLINIIVNEFTN